jgi:hypothetical protein
MITTTVSDCYDAPVREDGEQRTLHVRMGYTSERRESNTVQEGYE